MAIIRGVEQDTEQAVKAVIEAQLVSDGLAHVTVGAQSLEAPGEEPQKPYVYVACRPATHTGASVGKWDTDVSVMIMTQHLTTQDRLATEMHTIMQSVCYALDAGDFSAQALRLNSIQIRRTGGDYIFESSTNQVNIDCEAILCG